MPVDRVRGELAAAAGHRQVARLLLEVEVARLLGEGEEDREDVANRRVLELLGARREIELALQV
ncbi:MAG TPA: hypothetical protein VER75_05975, partial [Thermoleophilaceae bacterium]|nr:hypothetical protein [Thermoleophilaceae bacterium]